jgi:hypothetical protein
MIIKLLADFTHTVKLRVVLICQSLKIGCDVVDWIYLTRVIGFIAGLL